MERPETPLLRRPNGRPQACEPCRKRKVACDHRHPICNRCVKRKQRANCVYLVGTPGSGSPSRARVSRAPPSPTSMSLPSSGHGVIMSTHPARSPHAATSPESQLSNPAAVRPGYLGFTSFSTVFRETQNSLSLLQGPPGTSSPVREGTARHGDPTNRDPPSTVSPRTLEMCLSVLRSVPDATKGAMDFRSRPYEGWAYHLAEKVFRSFYETFGQYFGPDRDDSLLAGVARMLCHNTAQPFSDDETSPDRWLGQFTGPNTRWESLGLLSTFLDFSLTSTTLREDDGRDKYGVDGLLGKRSLQLCIDLCRELSTGNTLLLYMLHRRTIAESMFTGDASLRVWTYHAEAAALLTFLGYHALDNVKPYVPSICSEIKRRLYHKLYTVDMVIVSFTGRPPLLSRRFATTILPLDLRHEDLFSDPATMARAAETLDETGWNTDGRIHPETSMRARAILAAIREELLVIALRHGQLPPVDVLLALRDRENQAFDQLPRALMYTEDDLEDPDVPVGILYMRLLLRLEHLQNLFFVERLLHRHGDYRDRGDLLSVSFDMVHFTMYFWTHLDRLADVRLCCEWVVMAYGVPAGGILCLELLKPTLHNHPPSNPDLTRSGIIQKLSLLVGFLDWIKPTAPNGELCGNCKSIIRHVLDQTLNAPASGPGSTGAFYWDFATQVDFNFDSSTHSTGLDRNSP